MNLLSRRIEVKKCLRDFSVFAVIYDFSVPSQLLSPPVFLKRNF